MQKPPQTPNLTPKERFQLEPTAVTSHQTIISSPSFQRSADAALLQYAAYLGSQSVDGNGAAASHFKMLGAQEFLATFRMMGEQQMAPKIVDRDNLQHS